MDRRAAAVGVLEARLGHVFADRQLIERALTHSSAGQGAKKIADNERLEFLGDLRQMTMTTNAVSAHIFIDLGVMGTQSQAAPGPTYTRFRVDNSGRRDDTSPQREQGSGQQSPQKPGGLVVDAGAATLARTGHVQDTHLVRASPRPHIFLVR